MELSFHSFLAQALLKRMLPNFASSLAPKASLFHQKTIVFHNKDGSIFKWHCIVQVTVTMTEMQVSCFFLSVKSKREWKWTSRPQRKISVFLLLRFVCCSKFNTQLRWGGHSKLSGSCSQDSVYYHVLLWNPFLKQKLSRPWTFFIISESEAEHQV